MSLIQSLYAYFRKKALADQHPELLDREPLLRLSSEEQQMSSGVSSFTQNAQSYATHMWLQKAINVLANNIAPLQLRVIRGSRNDVQAIENHPILRLLDNPNGVMSPEDLWRAWIVDLMLGGEFGLEVAKNSQGHPLELWPKQPEEFIVRAESTRYRRVAGYKIDDSHGEPYILTPEEFIHFKFYNPQQPFRGISPVSAVRLSIMIDQLAQAWSRLFFRNSARPDFAVIAPEGVTRTEKEEILAKLRSDHSGVHAHEPIVLESGITDIKTFSYPTKDIEWVSQREFSRDEVSAIVGVPDEIMGYGKDTYENFDTAERVLWTVTIVPLCGMRDGTLTRFFRRAGYLAANEQIKTDLRNISPLQEDISSKIAQGRTLFEMGVPVNTISDYLALGLDEIPGGDIGYLPSTYVPVDQLPWQTGGGILGLAASPLHTEHKHITKGSTQYGSVEHDAVYKRLQSRLDNPVAELKRIAKKEFQRQQNEINQKLRAGKTFGRGLYKDSDDIPSVSSLFDPSEEARKWVEALKEKLFQAVQQIGDDELGSLGVSGVFDISRPEVVSQLRELLEKVARKVNDTTFVELTELFQTAEQLGEGIPAIQERLSTYFGDRKSDYQTERIARTTMTGASNAGSREAWKQARDENGVNVKKEWVSALQPDRSRESHMEAHGQQVGLDEAFTVDGENLMYPGDPTGSPGNIINCLCGMIPIVED